MIIAMQIPINIIVLRILQHTAGDQIWGLAAQPKP